MVSNAVKLLLLSSVFVALACGDDAVAPTPGAADAGVISPQVCSELSAATPGVTTRSIMVAGVARSYELSIPADYDHTQPARLLFGWHGLGGNGALLRAYTDVEGQSLTAPGDSASIFAYPDALVLDTFGATGWEIGDAALFDAIAAELSAEFCIDASRIFSYGHSFGGYFSNALGCLRGSKVRAIAPVAGGLLGGLSSCEGAMPAWLSHADDDGTVPVAQGIAARDKWLSENQCSLATEPAEPSPCVSYSDCQSGARVVWCETVSGGHGWPTYANSAIWDFFASFDTLNL